MASPKSDNTFGECTCLVLGLVYLPEESVGMLKVIRQGSLFGLQFRTQSHKYERHLNMHLIMC